MLYRCQAHNNITNIENIIEMNIKHILNIQKVSITNTNSKYVDIKHDRVIVDKLHLSKEKL
jgi:hypothetical protein